MSVFVFSAGRFFFTSVALTSLARESKIRRARALRLVEKKGQSPPLIFPGLCAGVWKVECDCSLLFLFVRACKFARTAKTLVPKRTRQKVCHCWNGLSRELHPSGKALMRILLFANVLVT